MPESLNNPNKKTINQELSPEKINELQSNLAERIKEDVEAAEKATRRHNPEKESSARKEALELANEVDKESSTDEKAATASPERPHKPTKRELNASFDRTMAQVRSEMNPASRAFSKVIHNPVVDKVSSAAGSTVARPNLIVAGALGTLILCSAIYFIAKHYSYALSGFEAIATFILGWSIGAVVEFARVGFKNKPLA